LPLRGSREAVPLAIVFLGTELPADGRHAVACIIREAVRSGRPEDAAIASAGRQRRRIVARRQGIAADLDAVRIGGVDARAVASLVVGDLEAVRTALDLREGTADQDTEATGIG